jgi:hypothetical protein
MRLVFSLQIVRIIIGMSNRRVIYIPCSLSPGEVSWRCHSYSLSDMTSRMLRAGHRVGMMATAAPPQVPRSQQNS